MEEKVDVEKEGGRKGDLCFFNSRLDVARPDKTSGADINAICQEVTCINIS